MLSPPTTNAPLKVPAPPIRYSVPMPVLVSEPGPEISPSIVMSPPQVSNVPPLGPMTYERLESNGADVISAPPSSVTMLSGAPRCRSSLASTSPCVTVSALNELLTLLRNKSPVPDLVIPCAPLIGPLTINLDEPLITQL